MSNRHPNQLHSLHYTLSACFRLSSLVLSTINRRSPDLLQPEEPFTLSERRSSSDSNKVSSGEVSPYDNNSPILSERRGEPGSPGSEQYTVVGQVSGWSREHGADSWAAKGELERVKSGQFKIAATH